MFTHTFSNGQTKDRGEISLSEAISALLSFVLDKAPLSISSWEHLQVGKGTYPVYVLLNWQYLNEP